jgi:hypothetical protein
MEAKELRIGNLLICDGETLHKVDHMTFHQMHFNNLHGRPERLSPIPITSEWLERFGLKKQDIYASYDFLDFGLSHSWDDNGWHVYKGHNCMSVYIKYVHQLQNLYFALTGMELEIRKTITNIGDTELRLI